MTERELREIKRRFRPEHSNIPRIVGCFVNSNKQILYRISQPMTLGDSTVSEMLLGVMKKTLSGTLGTNLTDVSFTTSQVSNSEEHRLLMQLRDSELKDGEALEKFYSRITECVSFEGNYVILLANDVYDVPSRSSDGGSSDSTATFSYLVCAICPVKDTPAALSFREADSLFHTAGISSLLSSPELGFMFPAFDDRCTNIYGALYYTRSIAEKYSSFCDAIFGSEAPMPPKAQRVAFSEVLTEALAEECDLNLITSMQGQIAEMVEAHKESRDPEPLVLTKATVKEMLSYCGVGDEKLEQVGKALDESFGANAELRPKNIVTTNRFELKMPEVTIKVSPEHKNLVTTQTIGGEKYVMIRVSGPVEINGITINTDED